LFCVRYYYSQELIKRETMPPHSVVVVSSVQGFCYHQSQFMRDQYLNNPELLVYNVRTVLGRAATARWSRADIVEQFYQALQPPPRPAVAAIAAAGTTTATTRRNISEEENNSGKLRLEENVPASRQSSVADSDADNDSLRPVAASSPPTTTRPARKHQKSEEVEEEETTTRTPTTAASKQPPQLKTPTRPSTFQTTNATGASHQPSGGDSSSQNKKRDNHGRIKRPQGRAPKGKRWDDVNGAWIGCGDDDNHAVTKAPARMRSMNLTKDWKQAPVTPNTGAVATAATRKATRKKRKTAPAANSKGMYTQPQGRPPRNKVWDRTVGKWRTLQP
jgi:hypothetical protein